MDYGGRPTWQVRAALDEAPAGWIPRSWRPTVPDDVPPHPADLKYYRIKRHLLEEIESLPMGGLVPSERVMAAALGTSRTTVRRALAELTAEGRVARRQGARTVVAEPKITWPLARFAGGSGGNTGADGADRTGEVATPDVRADVLDVTTSAADSVVAQRLSIEQGAPVTSIQQLLTAGGRPVAVEVTHASAVRFPDLGEQVRCGRNVAAVLRDAYGTAIVRSGLLLTVSPASPGDAALLRLTAGAPVLVASLHGRNACGEPVIWVSGTYVGERITVAAEIVPGPGGPDARKAPPGPLV